MAQNPKTLDLPVHQSSIDPGSSSASRARPVSPRSLFLQFSPDASRETAGRGLVGSLSVSPMTNNFLETFKTLGQNVTGIAELRTEAVDEGSLAEGLLWKAGSIRNIGGFV